MSGNSNSGRKPHRRVKFDYGKYVKLCRKNGFNSRRSISRAICVADTTVQDWEAMGWPSYGFNRLIVNLGLRRDEAFKLLGVTEDNDEA